MKKIFIYILFLFFLFALGGCNNKVKPNEGKITLYLNENFTKHMKYEKIPSFTITFPGVINTSGVDTVESYYAIFSSNDDLKVSNIISDLLEKNNENTYIELEKTKENKYSRINTIENGEVKTLSLPTDNEIEYYEIAYIELENGLKLSINYRRFVSEGISYYVWRYERNIVMWLYYPLMVIDNDGDKEFVIITLPNRIKFAVGPHLNADKIISDQTYIKNEGLYSFAYLGEFNSLQEEKQYVIDYYVNNYDGYFENEKLYFTYLGIKFFITFGENKFYMEFVEKV